MEGKPKKILVVEDEVDNLKILSMALKSAGYIVFGATNGEEGLEIFREEKPDLVILDVMMPVMDGWEVLKRIKAGLRSRRVPVIMLTAKNTDMDKIKGYDYGADFYVTKPYNIKKLLPIIRDMLSK
ncbi:MAG: response regulator [Candidatus Omnitrophica bacterium]|nr:response regulator [Candidatus Omnitrophota bacterium]MCM8777229.1 response regulator [Candidatus Omnitrophota bacterium]